MSEEEKLIALRAMVGGSDTDEVLSTYLKLAGRKIIARAYPYDPSVTEVPVQYDTLQCEIAAYMLNKRGAEGQTSHSRERYIPFLRKCRCSSVHAQGSYSALWGD